MSWKHLFAKKDLEMLLAEMAGDNRLRRVLGPVALTSLGVGAIIGAGIFVLTGVAAADDAGPAIIVSFAVAAVGCAFAGLCYAEFASMAPVAGSVYTYAYTTLGEIFAWIIGWDLILEYAMGCAVVASSWTGYFNEFLGVLRLPQLVPQLCNDPFTVIEGTTAHGWFNLPSVLIMILVTIVLVVGIRESARTNAALVMIKVAVVLLVIVVGWAYVVPANWRSISASQRVLPQERVIPQLTKDYCKELVEPARAAALTRELAARYRLERVQQEVDRLGKAEELAPALGKLITEVVSQDVALDLPRTATDRAMVEELLSRARAAGRVTSGLVETYLSDEFTTAARVEMLAKELAAKYRLEWAQQEADRLVKAERLSVDAAEKMIAMVAEQARPDLPHAPIDRAIVAELLPRVHEEGEVKVASSWGLLGLVGLNRWLVPMDDAVRSPFIPYGLSGIMLGAAIVFFAFIGFDSISTHAEEARRPQRDVPIGILVSLVLCTMLYVAVAAVITGMVPYPKIDVRAPIAVAFSQRAAAEESDLLHWATGLIAAGGLAGMTSVLLVTFLSQARIFLAMARDGLLPPMFGTVHPRFRTPHLATMLTGAVICVVAAVTPIRKLAEMVNIGTLLAFVMVCMAVLILRRKRPDAKRPFRCPALYVVAPLGVAVNLILMLFLPIDTWIRLLVWLAVGMAIYFGYSRRHSHLLKHLLHEIQKPGTEEIEPAGESTVG